MSFPRFVSLFSTFISIGLIFQSTNIQVSSRRKLRSFCPPTLDICREIANTRMTKLAEELALSIREDQANERKQIEQRSLDIKQKQSLQEHLTAQKAEDKVRKANEIAEMEERKKRTFRHFIKKHKGVEDIDTVHKALIQSHKNSDWDLMVDLKATQIEGDKFQEELVERRIENRKRRDRIRQYRRFQEEASSKVVEPIEDIDFADTRKRTIKGATDTEKLLATRGRYGWEKKQILRQHINAV